MSDPRTFRALALAACLALPPLAAHAAPGAPAGTDVPVFVVAAQDTWWHVQGQFPDAAPRIDRQGNALMLIETRADKLGALGRHVHETERRCGGFFAFASRAEADAFLASDRAAQAAAQVPRGGYTIDNQATVLPWLDQVSEPAIRATISHLESYNNRFYASATGADAAVWIRDEWLALAGGRSDVTAELFTDCALCSGQPSVILTIEGTTWPDEVVVLGGHLDSVTWQSSNQVTARAPGADDDASGIATLTEILRIAMDSGYRPARTVKFMGYAAEEVGLLGSHAIADSFASDGVDVVGVLQLDMTNYHEPGQVDIEIINDATSPVLNTYLGALFDEYLQPLGLTRGSSPCGYACSDHSSWTDAGYPSAFAFEGGGLAHSFDLIHTAFDLMDEMGNTAERSRPFAQLGLAFLGEVAKGTTGPLDGIYADGFEAPAGAAAGVGR
jgi:leucyl aminopeptidase